METTFEDLTQIMLEKIKQDNWEMAEKIARLIAEECNKRIKVV
jgi:hypothetical protein